MKYDSYGQVFVQTSEICDLLYKNPELKIENFLVEDPETYNKSVQFFHVDFPKLKKYTKDSSSSSIEEFDMYNQSNWFMPESFKLMDIKSFLIAKCKSQQELNRIEQEFKLFEERNLVELLKFLHYLVETLRQNNIVWGVGRGSSVASYVLFLLGVHRIDSLKYDLDISEFLK